MVSSMTTAVDVIAGDRHTCALLAEGAVQCWGYNAWGNLGNGTDDARTTPGFVSGIVDAEEIASGGLQACALRATGAVMCWGRDGSSFDRWTPVQVPGL